MKLSLVFACVFSTLTFADSFHAKFSGDPKPSKDDKNLIEIHDPKVRFVRGSKIYTIPFALFREHQIGKLCNEFGYAYGASAQMRNEGNLSVFIQWGKKPRFRSKQVFKSFSCYAKDPLPKAKSEFIFDSKELPNGVVKISGHKPFSKFIYYKDDKNKRIQYLKVTYDESKLYNAAAATLCPGLGFTHAVVSVGSANPRWITTSYSEGKYFDKRGRLWDGEFEKGFTLTPHRNCVNFDSPKAAKIEIYVRGKNPITAKARFWAEKTDNKDGSFTLTNILIAREDQKLARSVDSSNPVDVCQAFGFSHIHAEKTKRREYPSVKISGSWKKNGPLRWHTQESRAFLHSVTCETL